jgi:hypothetical protein
VLVASPLLSRRLDHSECAVLSVEIEPRWSDEYRMAGSAATDAVAALFWGALPGMPALFDWRERWENLSVTRFRTDIVRDFAGDG